jgi:hypothetical protein
LGLVAKADGQLAEALRVLKEARTMAKDIPYLRRRIELWLSEVHLIRQDPDSADRSTRFLLLAGIANPTARTYYLAFSQQI